MYRIIKKINNYNNGATSAEHRERLIKMYFYICSIVASISNVSFSLIDFLSNLSNPYVAVLIRFTFTFLLLINMFVGSKVSKKNNANYRIFIFTGFFIELVYMTILSAFAGGFNSVYWVGYCMLLVFWFGQPFSWIFLLNISIIASFIYSLILYQFQNTFILNNIIVSISFIFGIISLGVMNSFLSNMFSMQLFEKEEDLQCEKEKSENLLLNILPAHIADRLKSGEITISDYYDKVAILFADIVGFTSFCSNKKSEEIVKVLNEIFFAFDTKTEELGLEKIKTIGDGYLAMGGGLKTDEKQLLKTIALGDYMIKFMKKYSSVNNAQFSIRVGIHIGNVTAGVIGKTKFAFDIWGDTVNVASRMESSGVPMEIHITEEVANLIEDKTRCKYRGEVEIKGKGLMKTYIINRYDD